MCGISDPYPPLPFIIAVLLLAFLGLWKVVEVFIFIFTHLHWQ